jgi:hypothetical protein
MQGQIMYVILAWMGNATGIADVAALGRVGALFGVIGTTVGGVLIPAFATCGDSNRLPKLYGLIVAASIFALGAACIAAFAWPSAILLILGSDYSKLEAELCLAIATACCAQVGAVMWYLNTSRGWTFVVDYGLIAVTLVAQIMCVAFLDLRQTFNVIAMHFACTLVWMPLLVADAIVGLTRVRPRTVS